MAKNRSKIGHSGGLRGPDSALKSPKLGGRTEGEMLVDADARRRRRVQDEVRFTEVPGAPGAALSG